MPRKVFQDFEEMFNPLGAPFSVLGFTTFAVLMMQNLVASDYTCGPYATTSLKKGDTSVVCIEYSHSGNGSATSYASFNPKVDTFSAFDVDENRSSTFWDDATSTTAQVRAKVGNYTTEWVSLVDHAALTQVEFFTLMINMNVGKVNQINWDSNCVCDHCITNNCASSCTNGSCTAAVKMYVTWTGTDSGNTVMLSAANRYSELQKYSGSSMYNNAANMYSSYCEDPDCGVADQSARRAVAPKASKDTQRN